MINVIEFDSLSALRARIGQLSATLDRATATGCSYPDVEAEFVECCDLSLAYSRYLAAEPFDFDDEPLPF